MELPDLKPYTEAELIELGNMLGMEHQRRREEEQQRAGAAVIIQDLVETGTITEPESVTEDTLPDTVDKVPAWKDPGTDHSRMYLQGRIVSFEGKVYKNTLALNPYCPETLNGGWADITAQIVPSEKPQPWVQPLGAHDSYRLGAVVTHDGKTWKNTSDGNAFAPGVFGWEVIDG